MTTESQTTANRKNAKQSTGPRSAAGREKSSRNALTLGLYTRQDYVQPQERDLYAEFCETMYAELTPAGLLEQSLVSEITAASWRLRRCYNAEGTLADFATEDPLLNDSTDKNRKSIERARAAAHGIMHRSLNQLRKLQTERVTREQLNLGNAEDTPLADSRKVCEALNLHTRNQKLFAEADSHEIDRQLANAMSGGGPTLDLASDDSDPEALIPEDPDSKTDPSGQSASNCETYIPSERAQRIKTWFSLCSCHSGLINQECCGKSDYETYQKAA